MSEPAFPDIHAAELARLAREDGSQGIIDFVRGFPDGRQRLQLWSLAMRAFGPEADLEDLIDVAEAGIDEALTQREDETDDERRRQLTDQANVMAYNLSADLADCWPEDARPREMRHLETGLEAAQLCLTWRDELGKGPGPISMAWWARGIHLLALGQAEEARDAFARSLEHAEADVASRGGSVQRDATGDWSVLLGWGWLALARHRQGADGTELDLVLATLDEAVRARPEEADDLRVCSDQLRCGRQRHGRR